MSATTLGRQQARRLADLFPKKKIDHVITSPYKRALQSIEPLAERKSLKINIDNRLVERKLSNQDLPDWLEKLEASFNNMNVYYSGGESSREAMNRGMGVINDILKESYQSTIVVTHGNLMALIIRYFQRDFGFEGWLNLSNPDVFLITITDQNVVITREWENI
ncbi:histidine phosphatase family protein [Terrilactibacillus laevilacticus]|uniref:histidine phosphatase family protein n=1 Tax=Terrilactibacillus laevilacticus TaxID=1380157 RepID=UPI00215AEDF6|nr:histidine phosphatase family protein [Terrilactibacillus laevilacticus]